MCSLLRSLLKGLILIFRVCPGGSFLWLHPFRTLSIVLGALFPFKGQMGYYFAKFSCKCLSYRGQDRCLFFTVYERYGSTCLSSIVFWSALPTFWLSSAEAIKTVSADRALFSKDLEAVSLTVVCLFSTSKLSHVQYKPLNIYGPNIVGTEGPEWKRHRSVANSAFNEVSMFFLAFIP